MIQPTRHPSTMHALLGMATLASLLAGGCTDHSTTAPRLSPQGASLDRAQPTYAITTLDVPGAVATVAEGINARGDVGGYYATADGTIHGFVLAAGTVTTIDYPGADYTDVRGIGADGDLVGTFASNDEEPAAYHGFRRTASGEFLPVHYSGHLYEILQRILPDGTILGCRHDHDLTGSMKGIVIALDGSSEIQAYASMTNGATPDRTRMVGQYTNTAASRTEGFQIIDGAFTPFIVPGSSMTVAWDVNPRGDVVGVFRNAAGFHGFVMTEGGFTRLDIAGASATRAFGVNARGDVVGMYAAGGKTHGFLASRVK